MSEQRKEREKREIKGNENEELFTNQESGEINFDSINFNINPFNSEENSKRENNYFNNNFMKGIEQKDNKNQLLEANNMSIFNNINPSMELNKNNTQLESLLLSNNNNNLNNINQIGDFSNMYNINNNINNYNINNFSQQIPPMYNNIYPQNKNDFLLMENCNYIPNNPNINYIDNKANSNFNYNPNTNIYNQINNDDNMQINYYNEQMNNSPNNIINYNSDLNNYTQRTGQICWVCPFCNNFNSQCKKLYFYFIFLLNSGKHL